MPEEIKTARNQVVDQFSPSKSRFKIEKVLLNLFLTLVGPTVRKHRQRRRNKRTLTNKRHSSDRATPTNCSRLSEKDGTKQVFRADIHPEPNKNMDKFKHKMEYVST